MSNPSRSVVALDDLAVISIHGDDAISFLNGQLTHDIAGLAPGQARLTGYCTAKGRLLATLIVWVDNTQPGQLYALIKADIAQAIIKKLSMFVLRAKVKLSLADARVYGVAEPASDQTAQDPTYHVRPDTKDVWIAAPSAGPVRYWVVACGAEAFSESTEEPSGTDAAQRWQAQDIAAGLPWIQASTQDVFIPQTLNLDLIDGVSFTKGCYPGQEVVARSHYRGTVKRRMAYGVAQADQSLAPQEPQAIAGTDIFNANKPDSPCGRVINAAFASNAWHFLLEIQLADLSDADFRLGASDGPAITLRPLPYEIN